MTTGRQPPGDDAGIPPVGTAAPFEPPDDDARQSRFPAPADLFSPRTFRRRRERVAERMEDGVLVLFGAKSVLDAWEERRFDPTFRIEPFRQEENLFWLTGLELPGAVVLLDGETAELEVFAPVPGQGDGVCERLGLDPPRPLEQLDEALRRRGEGRPAYIVVRSAEVPSLRSGFAETSAFPSLLPGGEPGTHPDEILRARFRERFPVSEVRSAVPMFTELRRTKDDEEVEALRRAARAGVAGFRAGISAVAPGVDECVVVGEMERAFRRSGAHRRAFAPVVQSGRDGLRSFVDVLDAYDGLNRTMQEGELVLLDYGAEVGYYVSDLARTVPVSGRFSERQRAAYEAYMTAYEGGLSTIGPGVSLMQAAEAAGEALRSALDDLPGWLRPQACEFAASASEHRPGHFLGMSLHEHEGYRVPLEPGEVLAYELHFRLPEQGWRISVEDMLLVTPDGCQVLSASLPRSPEELEELMAASSVR